MGSGGVDEAGAGDEFVDSTSGDSSWPSSASSLNKASKSAIGSVRVDDASASLVCVSVLTGVSASESVCASLPETA